MSTFHEAGGSGWRRPASLADSGSTFLAHISMYNQNPAVYEKSNNIIKIGHQERKRTPIFTRLFVGSQACSQTPVESACAGASPGEESERNAVLNSKPSGRPDRYIVNSLSQLLIQYLLRFDRLLAAFSETELPGRPVRHLD